MDAGGRATHGAVAEETKPRNTTPGKEELE